VTSTYIEGFVDVGGHLLCQIVDNFAKDNGVRYTCVEPDDSARRKKKKLSRLVDAQESEDPFSSAFKLHILCLCVRHA
jgi:hypothetical protein